MAADPSVSPADTIRRMMELTKAHQPERFDDVAREIHDRAAALLAVGERDRQHIARLAKVEEYAGVVADLNGEMRSTYGRAVSQADWKNALYHLETAVIRLRAVLADKEDAE